MIHLFLIVPFIIGIVGLAIGFWLFWKLIGWFIKWVKKKTSPPPVASTTSTTPPTPPVAPTPVPHSSGDHHGMGWFGKAVVIIIVLIAIKLTWNGVYLWQVRTTSIQQKLADQKAEARHPESWLWKFQWCEKGRGHPDDDYSRYVETRVEGFSTDERGISFLRFSYPSQATGKKIVFEWHRGGEKKWKHQSVEGPMDLYPGSTSDVITGVWFDKNDQGNVVPFEFVLTKLRFLGFQMER